MSRFVILIFMLITCICTSANATTVDFYADCIKGYDFGNANAENFILTPTNASCQNLCASECNSFSRLDSNGIQLNQEAMTNCMPVCQSGSIFSSPYYEEKTVSNVKTVVLKPAVSIAAACDTLAVTPDSLVTATQEIHKVTEFQAEVGAEIQVSVIGTGDTSKVNLCGKKAVTLIPMIRSLDPIDWNNSTAIKNIVQDQHTCTISLSPAVWGTLTNYTLWHLPATGWDRKCYWNARNVNYVNTAIPVKDGDELSIVWRGNYTSRQTLLPNGTTTLSLYNMLINGSSSQRSAAYDILLDRGKLQIMNPGDALDSTSYIELDGEGARTSYPGEAPDPADLDPANAPAGATWYGLSGKILDMNAVIQQDTTSTDCDTEEKRTNDYATCNTLLDPGEPLYSFSGKLDGFSTLPMDLAIRHFESNVSAGNYADNLGASWVYLDWGGCPHYSGENMQYFIGSSDPDDNSAWIDIPSPVFDNGEPIIPLTNGTLYFRIKGDESPGLSNTIEDMSVYYKDPAYRFGQYYVAVSQSTQTSSIIADGPIGKIVNAVRTVLFDEDKGVLKKLYNALIAQSNFISIVRALLALYIASTGLFYIMGLVQMDRNDMFKRLIKASLVLTVISPTSWEFFSVHFFKLFIDGGIELIARIISGSMTGVFSASALESNPAIIFSVFDGPFTMLTSSETWTKIGVLALTGVMGFVMAFIVMVSVVYYLIALAKTTLMFLMSSVIIALLLFMAPLFISMMLFRVTYQYFDSWVKFLISFTLQPVMLFACIAIFNILLLICLYTTLGFTVCPICLLNLNVADLFDWCIIDFYQILPFSHTPIDVTDAFAIPPGALAAVMMLIIVNAMYTFCDLIIGVCNFIVMGYSAQTTDLSAISAGAGESIKGAVGFGKAAMSKRKNSQETDSKGRAQGSATRMRQRVAGDRKAKVAALNKVGKP